MTPPPFGNFPEIHSFSYAQASLTYHHQCYKNPGFDLRFLPDIKQSKVLVSTTKIDIDNTLQFHPPF